MGSMDTIAAHASPGAHRVEPTNGPITLEELRMAYRCPGMPLDALRYERTPTGLHYQVVHWDIPAVDTGAWRLEIGGLVERPLSLSLDEIRSRPSMSVPVTLECAGNGRALMRPRPVSAAWFSEGVSTAQWLGTPLAPLLDEAGLGSGAVDIAFVGADRGVQGEEEQDYARGLPVDEAMRSEVLLAYEMNGQPLEPQHGAPLRLIVPGWYGMASVKWLTAIEVLDHPFDGFQNRVAYRYQADADDPGEPVTRMRVKSLMAPPGVAEFMSDRRFVERGHNTISGRAWSGVGTITRVEVGVDGVWHEAQLLEPIGERAWRGWSFGWDAVEGAHELACRATDSTGDSQPLEPAWNYQGMSNNAVQRIEVEVH